MVGNYFVNLAGDFNCDEQIRMELSKSGIPEVFNGRTNDEVPASYIGKLNGFVFKRAWRYWVVEGPMPLKTAEYIYQHYSNFGIRAGGDGTNPHPEKYAEPIGMQSKTKVIVEKYMRKGITIQQVEEEIKNIKNNSKRLYVMTYHIDTLEGLKMFVSTIKSRRIGSQKN